MNPILKAYLHTWFTTSIEDKRREQVHVEFTFDEFLTLFNKQQIKSLQKALDKGNLHYQQRSGNLSAFVFTWQSYAACSTRSFNKDTACITTRWESRINNLPKPGDTLRPEHVAKVAESLTGKPKTEEHKKNLSDALKGRPGRKWTEEQKQAQRDKWAAKRANKEIQK